MSSKDVYDFDDDFDNDFDEPNGSGDGEDDPYERGFADKLYEDYGDKPAEPETPELRPRPDISERGYRQSYTSQKPKKKKHRILRVIVSLLLTLVIIFGAALLLLHFISVPPQGGSRHKDDSCTILLAGTDESGDRTDTVMLLNLNRGERRISLMSIPRDTKVNSTYTPHKINIAYGVNGKGEEGMDSLMDYVADCVGFRPDGYILVELDVFIELVDLFGGVEFDVPRQMDYEDPSQDLFIHLQQGLQTLDGRQAMGLVRYRSGYADADIGRVSVQRDFLLAAIDQWASVKNVYKLPRALFLLMQNAVTDLSLQNLFWLAETAFVCGTDDMYMTTVPFYISGNYVVIDAGGGYTDLLNDYFNPYEREITREDLNIAY